MEFDRLDIQLKNAIPGTAPGISFFMLFLRPYSRRMPSESLRAAERDFPLTRGIFTLLIFRALVEPLRALNGLGQILLIRAPSNSGDLRKAPSDSGSKGSVKFCRPYNRRGQIQGSIVCARADSGALYDRLRQIQPSSDSGKALLSRYAVISSADFASLSGITGSILMFFWSDTQN